METKVTAQVRSHKKKESNIISGKNARILPKEVSLQDRFDKIEKLLADTPKPTGKPAAILYKKLPDNMILITGFENFLSLDELFDKYGRVIAKAYSDYSYHMASSIGAVFLSGMEPKYISHVAIGQLFNKHDFSMLIAHVKKCGGLLHDIIQAVNDGEVKRIEI